MHELEIWTTTLDALRDGQPVYLAILAATSGTTSRRVGAKMVVGPGGRIGGTVGGGRYEKELIEQLADDLRRGHLRARLMRTSPPGEPFRRPPSEEGLGCGTGSRTIVAVPLTTNDTATIRRMNRAVLSGKDATLEVTARGMSCCRGVDSRIDLEPGESWIYREPLRPREVLTVFGGGHVALALTRVMRPLGFHITVIDERADLDTFQRNRYAHKRLALPGEAYVERVAEGDHSYVAIMTPGHATDLKIVSRLIDKQLRYLGMLASHAKIVRIREALRIAGVPDQRIAAIRAPIGLSISSETPEEIAVSIAAEIIQVRRTTPDAGLDPRPSST